MNRDPLLTPARLPNRPFLIVTATEVETAALHAAMAPLPGETAIKPVYIGSHSYFIGTMGNAQAVHVQCSMGSSTHGGSILTTSAAIDDWNPSAVIMVGIAFGKDETSQNIGDVLIALQILPYESKRVGAETIQRGAPSLAGPILADRFKNTLGWMHLNEDGIPCKRIPGDVLSGEVLIDNLEYRNELLETFPTAIGGEMEGAGVAVATRAKHIHEWIIVKGICDFADGDKSKDKKRRQEFAARSAISLCRHVLSQPGCLNGLTPTAAPQTPTSADLNEVLFVAYTQRVEKYYYPTETDRTVEESLKTGNLWLWGPSGAGKTALLQRAAARLGMDTIFVDLSSSVNCRAEQALEDIYWARSRIGVNAQPNAWFRV